MAIGIELKMHRYPIFIKNTKMAICKELYTNLQNNEDIKNLKIV